MECLYCSGENGDKHGRMCLECWYHFFWPMPVNEKCEYCGSHRMVYEIEQILHTDRHYGSTQCTDCEFVWSSIELPLTPFVMLND